MRHKGKGPPDKLSGALFVRTNETITRRLESVRAARSEVAGVNLSRADVVRSLITEACLKLDGASK